MRSSWRSADTRTLCRRLHRLLCAARGRRSLPRRLGRAPAGIRPGARRRRGRAPAVRQRGGRPLPRRRLAKPRPFDFRGFTHYVTFGRHGGCSVGRRTIGKRVCKKLRELGDELAKRSTAGGTAMIDDAGRHLCGHIQYYGVSGNFRAVRVYLYQGAKALYQARVRRRQRRRLTWACFWERIAPQLPRARIVHNFFVPPAVWLTRTGSRMV